MSKRRYLSQLRGLLIAMVFFLLSCKSKSEKREVIILNDSNWKVSSVNTKSDFEFVTMDYSINSSFKTSSIKLSLPGGEISLQLTSIYGDIKDTVLNINNNLLLSTSTLTDDYYNIIKDSYEDTLKKITTIISDNYNIENNLHIKKISSGCFHHNEIETVYKMLDSNTQITIIENEKEAIQYTVSTNLKDSLIDFERYLNDPLIDNCLSTSNTCYILKCGTNIFYSRDYGKCFDFEKLK